jgi:outer membrane lipase/esterase
MFRTRETFVAAMVSVAAVAVAGQANAQTYGRIVSFGDSLTDKGSLSPPPPPPYFEGRFSNGPTWVERLGFDNVATYGGPVDGNVNYALGGATTAFSLPPEAGMQLQLQTYLSKGGAFGPHDLLTLWGGVNDLANNLDGALKGPDPELAITTVATEAAANIQTLADQAGARGAGTVLALNLMDIGAAPGSALPPGQPPSAASALITTGSNAFNSALLPDLRSVAAAHPGTNFIYMDVKALFDAVNKTPGAFGFVSAGGCYVSGVLCSNPDSYFYFDSLHPSAAGHQLIARLAQDYLYYGDRGASSAIEGEAGAANRLRSLKSVLDLARPGSGAPEMRNGLGIQVDGEDDTTSTRPLVAETGSKDGDVRIFLNRDFGSGRAGVAVNFGKGDAHAGPFAFDETNYGGDAYYGWSGHNAFVSAAAGASHMSFDARRATGVGPLVQTGSTDALTWGGSVQAGLLYQMGAFILSPRLQASFTSTHVDGYQEAGAAARYAYAGRTVQATTLDALLHAEHAIGGAASAFAEVGYENAVGYSADPVVTGLVDNSALPLARSVGKPYASEAVVGAGFTYHVAGRVDFEARYTGRFGDLTSNAASVGVRVAF